MGESSDGTGDGESAARRLSRTRSPRAKLPDTGRRHHIGDAPDVLPFVRPDGTVGTTRTSPIQLKDRSVAALERLQERLEKEMSAAAADLDFELAAHLRDEVEAVRAGCRADRPHLHLHLPLPPPPRS